MSLAEIALTAGGEMWGLFETGGDGHPWLELQCVDFPEHGDGFDSDEAAWCHVIKRAGEGHVPEKAALAYLCLISHEEIVGIFNFLYHGQYRTYIPRRESSPWRNVPE